MDNRVRTLYVEKKPGFDVEAQNLFQDLKESLSLSGLDSIRIVNCYHMCGIDQKEFEAIKYSIFSEKTVDKVAEDLSFDEKDKVFSVEYLPGQYDQRADSACQCVQIITQNEKPAILSAKIYILKGNLNDEEFNKIKNYCINSVDSREASLKKPDSLEVKVNVPESVENLDNFINMDDESLKNFMEERSLAMSFEDLKFCQKYFKVEEKRNPTITEIKVIDTYWSDHCRHTTFMTEITRVDVEEGTLSKPIKDVYKDYLNTRDFLYEKGSKPECLMDIATIAMKELRKKGVLDDLDQSDEINACSIVIDANINGKNEKWLLMFKNETHNHPTEIEPFGGAATCLGGAIRDPLSGRSYVYQAMRVTGSGDPRTRIEDTLSGKLPQKKITREAAHGYSSYGNQIGLATGQVAEIYNQGYVAKRMEVGAVIGAAPMENVRREAPKPSDVVILVGGRTGRDGCGGATGSSKKHTEKSLLDCGSEVQKGNPVQERKIQRLFRRHEVSTMIKRCNDFGAGGVSVAIGELTDGLKINLDLVPKKYEGLDGTELAISESQERMAVVVAKEDEEAFIKYAEEENLEATTVAKVTDENRLKMYWRGKDIVNLSREFLDTNGVRQKVEIRVKSPKEDLNYFKNKSSNLDLKDRWIKTLGDLNVCSQKGLVERFDSSIGAGSVLMPFGGKYQDTPSEGMVAKLPVLNGDTSTGSIMTYGFNPDIALWSPFHGAVYAVVESVAKIAACGGDISKVRLTFQEYFERLGKNPEKWGKPFAGLMGAFYAQKQLQIAAIGGKDSMSGSFKDMDVPPTLVSFAVNVVDVDKVISAELKKVGSKIVLLQLPMDEYYLPRFDVMKKNFKVLKDMIDRKEVLSAMTVKRGGICEAVSKMSFGNRMGIKLDKSEGLDWFYPYYGSMIVEIDKDVDLEKALKTVEYKILGETIEEESIVIGEDRLHINDIYKVWEETLEPVFQTKVNMEHKKIENIECICKERKSPAIKVAKPKVFIPVFPGTNCEYDSQRAFLRAGAEVQTMVLKNLTTKTIEDSILNMAKAINSSQIIMIPGGFSAGDEPDGSGKFIAAVFRNPRIKEAVMELLKSRDGLILGICNGFQALIKLGLVPFGEILDIEEDFPTLTYNKIGRHMSRMVNTKVVSNVSPWFSNVNVGDVHSIAISHGEGRFVCNEKLMKKLMDNGQIATQYVDFENNPSYDIKFNPNGSYYAVEGITSPDGRILGKMAHSERIGSNVIKNVPGNKDQKIFEAGVNYFK